jgi:hypothetical protein
MSERRIDSAGVVTGLILLAVGTLMLVTRYGDYDFGELVHTWWPMIVVLVGVPKLFRYETLWSGLWTIAIGTWMQLIQLRVFGMTWGNSWPLLLIAFGLGTIVRALSDVVLSRGEHHES